MRVWGNWVAGPLGTLAEGPFLCLCDVSMVLGICWLFQHSSELLPLPCAQSLPSIRAAGDRCYSSRTQALEWSVLAVEQCTGASPG